MNTPQPGSVTVGIEELVRIVLENIAGQHRHQWAVVGVTHPESPARPIHPRMAAPSLDITYVALKCHCGELRSVTMDGHWTMDQIMSQIGEQIATTQTGSSASTPEHPGPGA